MEQKLRTEQGAVELHALRTEAVDPSSFDLALVLDRGSHLFQLCTTACCSKWSAEKQERTRTSRWTNRCCSASSSGIPRASAIERRASSNRPCAVSHLERCVQRGARARGRIGVPRRLWHEENADAENERPDKANADDGAPRSRARDLSRSDRYAVYIEAPVSCARLCRTRSLVQATRIPKVMNSLDRTSW